MTHYIHRVYHPIGAIVANEHPTWLWYHFVLLMTWSASISLGWYFWSTFRQIMRFHRTIPEWWSDTKAECDTKAEWRQALGLRPTPYVQPPSMSSHGGEAMEFRK